MINPREEPEILANFAELFYQKRSRRGFTLYESKKIMQERNYFGAMMVETGMADALISGLTRNYTETIKPALRVIGTQTEVSKMAGMYIMITKDGPVFFADTTININPTVEEIVEITLLTAAAVRRFNITPRVGLMSYSNFGSSNTESAIKMRKAVEILHATHPELVVDGELQANFAFNQQLLKDNFPFSDLAETGVNTLIFPNLDSGNTAYKLLQTVGDAEAIGPILLGMKKPVHILQLGSSVREIVNMITIAVVDAQTRIPQAPDKAAISFVKE